MATGYNTPTPHSNNNTRQGWPTAMQPQHYNHNDTQPQHYHNTTTWWRHKHATVMTRICCDDMATTTWWGHNNYAMWHDHMTTTTMRGDLSLYLLTYNVVFSYVLIVVSFMSICLIYLLMFRTITIKCGWFHKLIPYGFHLENAMDSRNLHSPTDSMWSANFLSRIHLDNMDSKHRLS